MYKRPGHKKRQVVFRNLRDGVTYNVNVRAKILDAQRAHLPHFEQWVRSEWVSDTITVEDPGQDSETDIGTAEFRLVWTELMANEPTPANAVGEPTRHVRFNSVTQSYERFDPIAECKADIPNHSEMTFQADAVAQVQSDYDEAKADADAYPSVQQYQDQAARLKQDLENAKQRLEDIRTRLSAACEAAFPPENLTEADQRWVQIPTPLEEVEDEE